MMTLLDENTEIVLATRSNRDDGLILNLFSRIKFSY